MHGIKSLVFWCAIKTEHFSRSVSPLWEKKSLYCNIISISLKCKGTEESDKLQPPIPLRENVLSATGRIIFLTFLQADY